MPDVRIPLSQPLVMLDRCIGCGRERPESVVVLTQRGEQWSNLTTSVYDSMLRQYRVEFPACVACVPRVLSARRRYGWAMGAIALTALLAVAAVMAGLTAILGRPLSGGATAAVTIATFLATAVLLAGRFAPEPPIDFTVKYEEWRFSFADAAYARAFADRNRGVQR